MIGETLNTFIEKDEVCIAQGVLQIIINSITNVESNEEANSALKIYPNPTVDNLVVNFSGNTQLLSYKLFNTNGALLYNAKFNRSISNNQ